MKESNTVISLQLPKKLVLELKELAANSNLSMTGYIRLLLTNHCKVNNKND